MIVHMPCDNCGEDDHEILFSLPGMWIITATYNLGRCRQCGHLYIDPRPDAATLQSLYDANFYRGRIAELVEGTVDHHSTMLNHVRRLVPVGSKLLDIGCGVGDFITGLPEYTCDGYETSEIALEYCRYNSLKNRIVYGPKPTVIPHNFYGIVTAIEVVEHAFSPREIFQLAYDCLRPGGIFYYTTFPFDGWTPESDWGRDYIQPEQHLNFFTRPIAEQYLKRAGFSRTFDCDGLLPLGVK
jgi:SAM-dependent methyltransferase